MQTNTQNKHNVVILAGGMGSRLAPITDDVPKPLVPVGGIPTLERLTETLAKNGFSDALLTVCALPEAFDAYRDPNIALETVKGDTPLGSAGSVRAVIDRLADTFLVISGDTVTDFDLRHAMETHKKENRLATVLLTHADAPCEFGIVSCRDGRIVDFSEKPSWRDTFSDLVSTGIYILNKSLLQDIPGGICYDFGKDFFPRLLSRGVDIHGDVPAGHWWDIGTPESFYRCNMELSQGENVIGLECMLDEGASVSRSVLFDRVTVESGAHVESSILCEGVRIGAGCVVPAGCVIGKHTVIEDGVKLRPGARIKGGMRIGKDGTGGRFDFGTAKRRYFGDESIAGDRSELDSTFALRLGRALKSPSRSLRLCVLHGSSASALLYAELLIRGAMDAGAQVHDLGDAFPAVTSFAVSSYEADMAVHVDVQDSLSRVTFRFCDRAGLPLTREIQRGIEQRLASNTFDVCITPLPPISYEKEDLVLCRYCNWVQERVLSLAGSTFSVARRDEAGQFLYSNAKELGADVRFGGEGTDSYTVSPDGCRACAYTKNGKPLTYWHLVAIAAAESDERVIRLPARAPKAVEDYLRSMGKELVLYTDRRVAHEFPSPHSPYVHDGVLLCLSVVRALCDRHMTLDEAFSALPAFCVVKKELPAVSDSADKRASRIAQLSAKSGFPARVFWQNGCVTVYPNAAGGYTLLAEATGWETAEELCAETEKLL